MWEGGGTLTFLSDGDGGDEGLTCSHLWEIDGDIAVVRSGASVQNGDIVAVLIENVPAVKRYYADNGFVFFQADSGVRPIIGSESMILGKVISSVRYFDEKGAFLITKAGLTICEYLDISKGTLYSYLGKIREENR